MNEQLDIESLDILIQAVDAYQAELETNRLILTNAANVCDAAMGSDAIAQKHIGRLYETLEELEALLETAGGFCTGKVLQNRHTPDPHSFIGEGKAQEVRMLIEATASTMAVFDNELSPGHIRALEEILGVTVLDRSALILDIFAAHARTREGKLQVEIAQQKYSVICSQLGD